MRNAMYFRALTLFTLPLSLAMMTTFVVKSNQARLGLRPLHFLAWTWYTEEDIADQWALNRLPGVRIRLGLSHPSRMGELAGCGFSPSLDRRPRFTQEPIFFFPNLFG